MRLPKDILSGNYIRPRLFLCEANKERICQLEASELKGSFKLNAYSELTFEVGRIYNDLITGEQKVNPYYNKIEAVRLVELEDFGFFELQGPKINSDGIKEAKECTAYSLEYTLSQKYLDDFYINTGEYGSVEVTYAEENNQGIIPVTLYNPSNERLSLLHIILEKIYGWKIGHVDLSLQKLSRQFEIDRSSVYDFLMNEVCEKFNCYVIFDTIDNTINLYAESLTSKFIGDGITNRFVISPPFGQIGTVSVDGYKTTRWDYNPSTGVLMLDDIPESGAHIEVVDGALTEWETDVFITFDNLAQEIDIDYDADSIKTVLTVTYGDGNDIREINLGLPYLTDISYYYTVDWMGQELYDAYTKYLQKSNSYQLQYTNNSQEMLDWAGRIDFEENRLSLGYSVVQSVSGTTVGTYYVRGGTSPNYYYTEVSLPSEYDANTTYYRVDTANLSETKVSNLFTVLKKNFNNEGDWEAELDELAGDFQFMETYNFNYLKDALKNASSLATKEAATKNFLGEMWNEIGRTPLQKMYYEPYKKVQLTNIEAGWSNSADDKYWYYYPVVIYLETIEAAISEREKLIKEYTEEYNKILKKNMAIADELLMTKNFTEDQLIRLSAFLREDELQLDDIITTSQDTIADSFKVKQDAMESGRIELNKLCKPQLQFSMSMANIYALPEFEPIVHQFQLGNVVKVGLRPDYIMQSRLLQVDVNFENFSDFTCEFGELTTLRTQSDIHADLLSQAINAGKSVATNSSYWTKGAEQSGKIQQNIEAGLLDAITSIKSMDGTQGVEIDKYGIHLKDINPNTGEVDPKQGWITNNKFLYSDDGFKSTKSVFGEFTYDGNTYYGILAEALVGSLIVGTQIEIGNAYGTMKFNENGLSVTNGTNSFAVDPNSETLLSLSTKNAETNEVEKIFYVDENGMLHIKGDGAGLDITNNDTVNGIYNEFQVTKEGILSTTRKELAAVKDGIYDYVGDVEDGVYEYVGTVESTFKKTADEISASVTEETERAEAAEDGLRKTIDTKSAEWSVTADEIRGSVNDVKTTLENDYLTTEETKSAISQTAKSITSTVTSLEDTVDTLASKVVHYGTCSTAAATAAKVVTCNDFVLYKGATISVYFSYSNSAGSPSLNVNNTGAKSIIAYGAALGATSAYNWSANSVVTFVYDGNYWRISDSGSLYQTSQIRQTASDISATVATYSSKIQYYGTCSTGASTTAKVVSDCDNSFPTTLTKGLGVSIRFTNANSASAPTLNVNGTGAKYIKGNGTSAGGNWSAGSIVAFVYDGTYWRIADAGALAQLKITADSISSKVSKGDVGTLIEQNAESVRIAWNNNSKYIQFSNAALNIYNTSDKLLMKLNNSGMNIYDSNSTILMSLGSTGAWYYENGTAVGKIGTTTWAGTNYRGLSFNTENSTKFMTWGHRKNSTDNVYTARLSYFSDDSIVDNGLHIACNTHCEGNFAVYSNHSFTIFGNNDVHFYSSINMHNWDIIDADLVDSSDARLKTNIQDTSVNALDIISQIEMKEFDWIEDGTHEDVGIIAQQLQTVAPSLVYEDETTGQLFIKTNKFIPYLIKAVKELSNYIMNPVMLLDADFTTGWVDPYTDEEKMTFVAAANSTRKDKYKTLESKSFQYK